MGSRIENKNESLTESNYEEIANIRETIAQSSVIDGEETFEEDSVVEVDLKDFEEVGAVPGNKYLKSMNIIDEFENDFNDKNTLPGKYGSSGDSFNVEKLTFQIDSLTTVKKRKKVIMPVKPVVPKEAKEDKKTFIEQPGKAIKEIENIQEIEDIVEIKELKETVKPQQIIQKQDIQEKPGIKVEIKEIPAMKSDIEQILQVAEKVKDLVEELKETQESKNIAAEAPGFEFNENILNTIIENKLDKLQEAIKEAKEAPKEEAERQPGRGSITIEIPDKLAGEFPADFNIDELGKINLKEAEVIAEEDLLFLTKGELFKELQGLNILSEQVKENREKTKTIVLKLKPEKENKNESGIKEVVIEEPAKKTEEEKDIKTEKSVQNAKTEKTEGHAEPVTIKIKEEILEPAEVIAAIEDKKETSAKTALEEEKKKEQPADTDTKSNIDTDINIQFNQDEAGKEIKDENVFIIDNKPDKTVSHTKIPEIDELEDITSTAVDVIGGKAKQLTESESADRKGITGLIRDNYPTFKDLLKEKEVKDKHQYSDDDIDFIDNLILTHNTAERSSILKDASDERVKEKKASPYEQILGLIPDELEMIESQLFKRKADLSKTTAKKAGLDQHPSDTISLSKYKYILPAHDSLMEHEKKSIEEDISTQNALIFEEDVAKIKKKLDDSMKKEITETINDITDRITIYEENNKNEAGESKLKDKEEIKKLLGYLNELFEKLPEENIKNFADSEYYELYKKLL